MTSPSETRRRPPDTRPSPALLKASGQVALMTLVSRLLGFVRDLVIAGTFGATGATDAFFVAFKIPNLLRRLFAEGAFSQAFVPIVARAREQGGRQSVRRAADPIFGTFSLALVLLALLGMASSRFLIELFAPGLGREAGLLDLGGDLLRLTFPYLPLIALTALAGGLLNIYGHFAIPAITPALLNVALIGAAIGLNDRLAVPIEALAIGVLVGGVLQLALQIPALVRLELLPRFQLAPRHPAVQQLLGRMAPALFGASIAQINLLINTFLASRLETGSISWLYYSDRLLEFPLGLIGVALGTVILPKLSRLSARGDRGGFSDTLSLGLGASLLLGLPAALGLAVLAEPLMFTLFQHAHFEVIDAERAARSLVAYALGLPGFLAIRILVPAFSAHEDLRTPARIGVIAVFVNLTVSLIATHGFAPPGYGHAGLALAVSLSALFNALALLVVLWRRGHWALPKGLLPFLVRLGLANLVLGLGLRALNAPLDFVTLSPLERIGQLSLLLLEGLTLYFGTLWLLGLRGRRLRPALNQTPD